jgi:hypothetical protein
MAARFKPAILPHQTEPHGRRRLLRAAPVSAAPAESLIAIRVWTFRALGRDHEMRTKDETLMVGAVNARHY